MLDRQGSITASTDSGEGGNIFLQASRLILRDNSSIVATAKGAIGNGGNLTIEAPLIVGLGNSDIVASAITGNGGRIQIATQGIFGLVNRSQSTLENDITASSQLGVSGTIEIKNVGIDPNSGLIQLPKELVDADQQVAAGCSTARGSSFVITGRGGIPQRPSEMIVVNRPWADLRTPVQPQRSTTTVTVPTPIVEATAWHRNAQTGKVELTAGQTAPGSTIATCNPV